MGVFAGIKVGSPITNQRRYDYVVSEIYNYLQIHSDEVNAVMEGNKFIVVSALYGGDSAYIPMQCGGLRSTFFRIHSGMSPPEDVKKFGAVLWETLHILKEHYPSKIEISNERIEACLPYLTEISAQEALRRQVSCVSSRKEELSILQFEEMEDLWFVLGTTTKNYDVKGTFLCLEALDSNVHCPAIVFKNTTREMLGLLEKLTEDSEDINTMQYPGIMEKIRGIARSILTKILQKHPDKARDCSFNEIAYLDAPRAHPGYENRYETPSSLNVFLFQLTETASIDRVVFLLRTLDRDDLLEELMNLNWPEKVKQIIGKYIENWYNTEDSDVVRLGIFQHTLLRSIIRLSKSPEIYHYLLSIDVFDHYYTIVEQSCDIAYSAIVNKEITEDYKIVEFIAGSMSLAELIMNPVYYKYMRKIASALGGVYSKLSSLTAPAAEDKDMPGPNDPEDLLLLSEELYDIRQKVSLILTKLDALLEYQEPHEEKFSRLFC